MPDALPTRGRHRWALILGALGLLLCWIPWAGLAVSAIALGVAVYARRRGAKVGWAAALGVWGLLLGIFFTGLVVVQPPAATTAADRETWDDFEKAFEDDEWPSDGGDEGPDEGADEGVDEGVDDGADEGAAGSGAESATGGGPRPGPGGGAGGTAELGTSPTR